MGTVYEATELDNGRHVALKLLTQRLEKTDRVRFLREGRLAASVSNPHTVYVFGTDEIQGIPVIAMEMADGGTLKDRVKTESPLPPPRQSTSSSKGSRGLKPRPTPVPTRNQIAVKSGPIACDERRRQAVRSTCRTRCWPAQLTVNCVKKAGTTPGGGTR